jgi:AcrR family transcriptional regulator
MTAAQGAARPGRADARRNREIVLRAAMSVLAEEGPGVSLGRIAQRAGVGAGTVYRHFPSKEILIEAVLAEQFQGLVAAADRWAARAAPGEALFEFLLEVIEASAGRRHVCDVVAGDQGWPRAMLAAAAQRYRDALERLLREARHVGAIRADVRAEDLSALVAGGVALRAAHRDPARGTRLVRLVLDGLRPPVTKPKALRDPPSPAGHETTGARHCLECGAPLRVGATGRPPRYCGPTCRQRAHRRRPAAEQDV